MNHVTIIIVNWNGFAYTRECLRSIDKLVKKDLKFSTIVVDNGSTDGSVEKIREDFPKVIVLPQDQNLGFTGGNNVGIAYALKNGSDYVWLLNNDTKVEKMALLSLLESGGDIVGSKIYFAPGFEYHKDRYQEKDRGRVIWYAGGNIDWQNMYASHRGVDEVDKGQYRTRTSTQFVTGCSMLIRSAVFERIGQFDERYYLYLEDVDFCLRAKRNGFSVVYEPRSIVWHYNAGSSGGAGSRLHDYYLTRNRMLLGFRYAPFRTKLALLRQGITLSLGKSSEQRRAITDAMTGRWGKQYEPDS